MVKRLIVTGSLLKLDFNSFGQKKMFESFALNQKLFIGEINLMNSKIISDSDEIKSICKKLNNIANKLDSVGVGNIPEKEDLYRSKLIALLEGLECKNIPELVKEKSPEHLNIIGCEIAKTIKDMKNIPFDVMKSTDSKINITSISKVDMELIEKSLQYFYIGEANALEFLEGEEEEDTMKLLNNIERVCEKLGTSLE
jgi:hypothetical protein